MKFESFLKKLVNFIQHAFENLDKNKKIIVKSVSLIIDILESCENDFKELVNLQNKMHEYEITSLI